VKPIILALCVAATATLPRPASAEERPATAWEKVQEAFASAIEKGHKSTVALEVKAKWKEQKPPGPGEMEPGRASNPNYNKRPAGVSTGVVIDADGHVLTSYFNVRGTVESITVILPGGEKIDGKMLGTDASKDLALIKVDPAAAKLSPIEWAKEKPQVGSFVMALGRSPEPDRGTATRGIVSAMDRVEHAMSGIAEHTIQFDAKTNYGNTGGPLVDLHGRLVGVVGHVRLWSNWGQNSGISFATPNWKIEEVLDRLKKGERIPAPKLPFLGVGQREGSGDDGAVIGMVTPDSAAMKAGLQAGDRVLQIGELEVKTWQDFTNYIKLKKPGDKVRIRVRRGDEEVTVEAEIGERPSNQ
jgi:serine protease Do